jgi:hypothetical protein
MVKPMGRMFDAFWRAVAYCLHGRVILLSLLPIVGTGLLAWALGYFFWESANDSVRATLDSWKLIDSLLGWLNFMGANSLRAFLTPLIVVLLATPVLAVFCLFVVALFMTPALVRLVAARRFRTLEKKRGGSAWWKALPWSLGHCIVAVLLLLVSLPFWLIPPVALIVPPLIWGWLGYRVFAYDVLAEHASVEERKELMTEHRGSLLLMGVITGYVGAAPAAIWAIGALALAFAPFVMIISVWLYVLVFAFSTLWFTHYSLSALAEMRARAAVVIQPVRVDPSLPPLPPAAPADVIEVLPP